MFWIKDNKGNLVNLARASDVTIRPPDAEGGKYEVQAYVPGWTHSHNTLFVGTREECGKFRDNLYAQLKEFQEVAVHA